MASLYTGANDIIDVSAVLRGESDDPGLPGGISTVKVYGPSRCKKLASSANPRTAVRINADNYAWFATSYFFSHKWAVSITSTDVAGLDVTEGTAASGDEAICQLDITTGEDVCSYINNTPVCTTDPSTGATTCVL
jgi:hypothetical protein